MAKTVFITLGLADGTTFEQQISVSETVKCICDVRLEETKETTETIEEIHIGDPPKKPEPEKKSKPHPITEESIGGEKVS